MTDKQDTHDRTHTAAGREQGEIRERADRQKKVCNIFKGEMREKHHRDSQKRVNVCIYISLNIVACRLFIALSFIY